MNIKIVYYIIILMLINFSCSFIGNDEDNQVDNIPLEFGGDFSLVKKMEDLGGLYKINGVVKEGLEIFQENGYTWARLRIFHTPNMEGPVCNDLNYTIALAKKAKQLGFKILLNFHYSDTWADPGHQTIPAAWKDLSFNQITDSVYTYTNNVIHEMDMANVLPDMVQIGNEINNGLLWPHGKLWQQAGVANWDNLSAILTAGINGVRDNTNRFIPILIHAATTGNINSSFRFYTNIIERGVEFDVIGMNYYPWEHGTFIDLEANLFILSHRFEKEISIVETAYYANDWYPEPSTWSLSIPPYPPTESGQDEFLTELALVIKRFPLVNTVFYWEPEGLEIPKSKINFVGRSLFDKNGNAFTGISAWNEVL